MPYPDKFNQSAFNRRMSSPEDLHPLEAERVYDAQDVCRDTLSAYIASCKKRKFIASVAEISTIMESVAESLADEVDSEIRTLQEAGFDISQYPDDHKKLCTDAAHSLLDALRTDTGRKLTESLGLAYSRDGLSQAHKEAALLEGVYAEFERQFIGKRNPRTLAEQSEAGTQ